MKKITLTIFFTILVCLLCSCAHSVPRDRDEHPRNRNLYLSGTKVSEADYGGVVRWVAFEKYNSTGNRKVIFQVGYFKKNEVGFVLFEGGRKGEFALFYRDGIRLRWDWKDYSIVITPEGDALYYDFKGEKEKVKPKGIYVAEKF